MVYLPSLCIACGEEGAALDTHLCWDCAKLAQEDADTSVTEQEHAADVVNHPPHYTRHPSGIECIDVTEHFNFNLGNAIKYIWRSGLKDSQKQDLEKSVWYIQRELERLSKGSETEQVS